MSDTVVWDDFFAVTKALSDPHRVRAFLALRKGEKCVCQLIELLELAPSTVSKHMLILKQAGLVESRKDSRWVYYRLPEPEHQSISTEILRRTTLDLLGWQPQTAADDSSMERIISEGVETICKRQRSCCGVAIPHLKKAKRSV